MYFPVLDRVGDMDLQRADTVCPFSDSPNDESEISGRLFAAPGNRYSHDIGYFNYLAIGHIAEGEIRLGSSSGGLTSWMLKELLHRHMVDGVIHVGPGTGILLSEYVVSGTHDELYGRRKSQYFPHEFSTVLNRIRGNGKRYAIVGLPCFIKAARNVAAVDPVFGQQLRHYIGLVCGHLKSGCFGEYLAWQVGVPPDRLKQVDFRHKVEHDTANGYHFGAAAADGKWKYRRMGSMNGGNWGTTFFQLKACEYCDDIVAETADVSFGDAWLERYNADWLGNNVVICRNAVFRDILAEGEARGELVLDPADEQMIVESQAGSFRHRRDGLSIRLEDARRQGVRMPRKRVAAGSRRPAFLFTAITRCRSRMAALSHEAYLRARDSNRIDVFEGEMQPLIRRMYWINRVRSLFKTASWVSAVRRLRSLRRPHGRG
jgi:coenzyme F420-reducing hydrogenase beta subunit